jgi:O-antigen/teichoic acid export membrane protein
MLYTFASVPLALHYLSRPEFGLWALTMQISGYIALIDAGMSASVSRILVDYKDSRSDGKYGSVIKTGALVGIVQGMLIAPIGLGLSLFAGSLFHIPESLQHQFMWLMIVQSGLLGIQFGTRIFGHILIAHQRWDISNFAQSTLFALSLLVMWVSLAAGMGVFSFLIAQGVLAIGPGINAVACARLNLLPKAGEWGRTSWLRFKELFGFGKDVFLYSVGTQFINASQTILLTRLFGLETAAVWSVCTRTYTMLGMLIGRALEYSGPIIAEMIVREERDRLAVRFRELAVVSTGISIISAALFGICNNDFVHIWTSGKMSWPMRNDVLLAIWMVICTTVRSHVVLIATTKKFGVLRYIFLLEGVTFVALNLCFLRNGTITTMLAFSILCTMLFSFPYAVWRVRQYFDLEPGTFAAWYTPTFQVLWRVVLIALGVWWATHNFHTKWRFLSNLLILGLSGIFVFLRFGLDPSFKADLWRKSTARVAPRFARILAYALRLP